MAIKGKQTHSWPEWAWGLWPTMSFFITQLKVFHQTCLIFRHYNNNVTDSHTRHGGLDKHRNHSWGGGEITTTFHFATKKIGLGGPQWIKIQQLKKKVNLMFAKQSWVVKTTPAALHYTMIIGATNCNIWLQIFYTGLYNSNVYAERSVQSN